MRGRVRIACVRSGLRALAYIFSREPGEAFSLRTAAIRVERLRRRERWRYSLRRRLPSVDRLPLDRPIFVLGLQGGGTTLISRCLLRHRAVVSMSGNSAYWVATDELGFVRNRMARLPSSLWSSSHRFDLEHPLFGTEHGSVYASDALLPYYRCTASAATAGDAKRFKRVLREHLAVYAHDPRHARFVDKTHTYTVKIPYLDALLAGCEPFFLLVLRNPYTMCFRAIRRKLPAWRSPLSYAEQLRLAAEHWQNSYRLALEDGPWTGRFAAVRFEDFVRNPESVVRAVCDAVQLEYDANLVPRPEHRLPFATLPSDRKWYPLRDDEWRHRVGDEEASIIEERCKPLAERLGYGRERDHGPAIASLLGVDAADPPAAAAATATRAQRASRGR
jgi:Sulfotransferase family